MEPDPTLRAAQQPEDLPAGPDPDFPDIIGGDQFLEILLRDPIKFLHQLQYPDYLPGLLGLKRIKKFLHRTSARFRPVKDYRSHNPKLTYM